MNPDKPRKTISGCTHHRSRRLVSPKPRTTGKLIRASAMPALPQEQQLGIHIAGARHLSKGHRVKPAQESLDGAKVSTKRKSPPQGGSVCANPFGYRAATARRVASLKRLRRSPRVWSQDTDLCGHGVGS